MLLNVGEAYIVVYLIRDTSEDEEGHESVRLKLKIFGGPQNGEI